MLMTKFTFSVEIRDGGAHTTVTRLADGAGQTFFQAGHTDPACMEYFMTSITDDQAENYFPKERKNKDKK